ncbi:MAG: ATP-grasp domain-containing protein [bacterium]
MAKLLEHQGKGWLREAGLAVPRGRAAGTAEEAAVVAAELACPVVVKAQVQAGGRGKSGGLAMAGTPAEAAVAASRLLGSALKGGLVRQVLVEEKLDIAHEFYAGYTVNSGREARCPMLMFSPEGGMDIESVPGDRLFRLLVSPTQGPDDAALLALLDRAEISPERRAALAGFLAGLFQAYRTYDCFTLEINPLVLTKTGDFVAADCKMEIDNNSVFRHPEMGIEVARDFGHDPTELDLIGWGIEEADQRGSGFLMSMGFDEKSPGYIGYHPIGGGSAMLGMDALSRVGLKVANYADTSGNPVGSKIYRVAKVVLSQPGIEGYLLGGFMMANQEQWHHAHAIVKALRETLPQRPGLPCLLLLCGNKEEESLAILREGLADLSGGERIEIYGREYVTDTEFIAKKMLSMVQEYQRAGGG